VIALMTWACLSAPISAQTTAALQGAVFDPSGAVLPGATITVRSQSTGLVRSTRTETDGRYHIEALAAGTYDVTAEASGFASAQLTALRFEVGRILVRDFHLAIGSRGETVEVTADQPLVDRVSSTVGHVVSERSIQEAPLNGRHYIELGMLVPGSVAPSQAGFSSTPIRGTGALAFNTAGNREEAVGYLINGVTTNNLTFGSLGFPPPIASIQEFKVDNSTFSAEYGHVSGAIVNLVTRSGSDRFHGAAYEFFRNDALDARNFFEFTTPDPHPFERNQFGGSIGGPLVRNQTFFFASYEGLRQRQGIDLNSLVLSDAQRSATTDPVSRRLLAFIPRANLFDADGTARFVGSADASVDENTFTIDTRHNAGARDRVHVFFGRQQVSGVEPGSQGTTIPGFGHTRAIVKRSLTIGESHIFGTGLLNEARFGLTGQDGSTFPATQLNPAELGIANGVDQPLGLPQIVVAGGLTFGGPAIYPQGRNDALYLLNDTLSSVSGRHSIRLGGEVRRFRNDNFAQGTGQFNFPNIGAFMTGTANAFAITLGEQQSDITQDALAFFAQDRIRVGNTLTLDAGVRYEWHVTPTERDDQFVVFDQATASLLRVGVDTPRIYRQNNANVEPRLGLAWDPGGRGRTVVRAAYGLAVDEPSTTAVRDTAGNPPFAVPLTASGAVDLADAVGTTRPRGLAPSTIDPQFRNASLQSWNVNVQRQVTRDMAVMAGYFGSSGDHLRISRNLNQPVNGVRPFAAVSPSSPIAPDAPLGNVTQVESTGFSSYNALWLSLSRRLARGLAFDASYTWSKSLDTNSLNSSGFAVQNGYDIPNEYGLSDFDARHRVVVTTSYALPFTGHALSRGWQITAIVQAQSGNPVNIVTSSATINGTPNTVRPDLVGPIRITGSVDQWFDPSAFQAVNRFGDLGRNVVIGPAFSNVDMSIGKRLMLAGRYRLELRADAFDVLNHANFASPGNIVGSPTFGKITKTRLPTGEAGSSRQIQLSVRLFL
jgi:outer membrane receptor protein involved in Fe transport